MYKVMLVDDENLIVQGLLNIIEWDKLGLEVTETADNAISAIEMFEKKPVNIVITDINMPKVTGLELIKKIRSIDEQVKFIILSGYDEFSYAKTAIEYGVENYILKPINEDELQQALIKIVDTMHREKEKQSRLLSKNRKLIQFINGKIDKSELCKIQQVINIGLNEKRYTVSSITIAQKGNKESSNINDIIERNTYGKCEIIRNYDGQVIIINPWNENSTKEDVMNYFYCIKDKLLEELDTDIFIGVGDLVDSIDKLKESYNVANKLKKYILTEGFNICLCKEDISKIKDNKRSFTKEIELINKLIIEKNNGKLQDYIIELFDDCRLTPKNIYDLSIKIIFLTDKISEEFEIDTKYSKDSLSNTIVELCNESTRDNVKAFLIRELEELGRLMNINTIKYSPVIQQIINSVNEKYYEELSLKTLAYQYNINSSYLGQIFTKEIGVSFSEYLNRTKNMKAKELILNTNMKINDIAKAVGFSDTSYFYRKFKKYYGVCPSTLREIKNY
ncbi:response regulator transcription factor [Clostridium estertheticum]|uniref:response regulator transcription factor n=1 Tax=Clostridium estertheticum TaxID=238834 RepID=UPI0013E9151F|nr:response regulator transcription factor [Clostridium estertheticum]MBZ9689297.1 response regulator transcription factor [Clostridium estertheticum]